MIEHTADMGIEVWGDSLSDLFRRAGEALFSLMWDRAKVRSVNEYPVSLSAETRDELMITMLSELLYIHEAEMAVFKNLEIKELSTKKVEAVAYGESFDHKRHHIKQGIKAVTYHDVNIRQENNMWYARLIFDI
ncbi:MAG: archease [Candidatus Eremiobacteraeota bacterium]|nr:archease [Candidatus Eremiobacteraeota bacterium]